MFASFMFCDVVLLLFMLFSASSMLEIHMSVIAIVMFNILELIMEIMLNYLRATPMGRPTLSAYIHLGRRGQK